MKKMEADIEGEKRKTDANTKAIEREKKKTDVNAKNIKSLENGQTSHSRRLAAVEVAGMEKADADAARDEKLDLLAKQQEADRAMAKKNREEDRALLDTQFKNVMSTQNEQFQTVMGAFGTLFRSVLLFTLLAFVLSLKDLTL